jgi:hypothetical protein
MPAVSIVSLTFRTWLRYLVPLTLLGVVALAAIAWLGLGVVPPTDAPSARAQMHLAWELAAAAWIFQLWLVAAVAPSMRGIARGKPLSQWQALSRGAINLVRAAVPCGIAVLAVILGGVALAIPGLALLVLLAMTGASDELGRALPAPLVDSVAVARASLRSIVVVVGLVIAVDLAIVVVAQLAILPALPKKPPLALLLPSRTFVRVVAAALVSVSPLLTSAIAAVYARRRG